MTAPRRAASAVVTIVAITAAACGGGRGSGGNGGPAPGPEAQASTSASAVATYEPLYSEAPCPANVPADPRVTCGVLTVPEDRAKPTGATVRLPVAVLKSADPAPAPDPVVYFSGGPGYSGLDEVGSFLTNELGGRRDVIFFDQRGTGGSEPSLDCPEAHEATATIFGAAASAGDEEQVAEDALAACRDRLLAAGVDLGAYDTIATADDVADLKRALGIADWNLFGVSYGTTVALQVLRAHPDGVRSAVVDSVLPTTVTDGLPGAAASLERVLGVLYTGCAAQPACAAAFPTLEADVSAVVASLDAHPYHGHITNPVLHREQDIAITGADALNGLFLAFYDDDLIPFLPSVVEAVRAGNGGAIIEQLATQGIEFVNRAAEAETGAVTCADRGRFFDAAAEARILREHPEYSTLAMLDLSMCARLGVDPAPKSFNDPVHSDVRTLVLAGEYDPVTPPADSKAVADALSDSTFVEFPAIGHGAVFSADCPKAVYLAFLDAPAVDVDTSCVQSMAPPAWKTDT